MNIVRNARLARVRDRDSVRLSCGLNEGKTALVVCASAFLAHVVVSGQVHMIVKAPAKIVDVGIYKDRAYIVSVTGHIWVIIVPKSTINGAPHIITLQRDNSTAVDPSKDQLVHNKKHQRSGDAKLIPLVCVPGAQTIFIYNEEVFVVTSKLYPTTLFIGNKYPTAIELPELEGEQSTSVCVISTNTPFILKCLGGLANAKYVILQGDTDGSLRYCVISNDDALLQSGTLFEENNKSIQSLVCLGKDLSIHGLLIKYAAGEAAIISDISGPINISKLGHLDCFDYLDQLNCIVYTSNGHLFTSSMDNINTELPIELALPQGVLRVVASGVHLYSLHSSGQLFTLSFPTKSSDFHKSLENQRLEAGFGGVGTSRKAGTDSSIKTQLIEIRNATEKKSQLLTKSKLLDKSLQSLNAAQQLLHEVKTNRISSVLSCVVRGHRPMEMSRGLRTTSRITIQVELSPSVAFQSKIFSQWVLQVIVHGEKLRQFNAPCPESLGASWCRTFEIEESVITPMLVECYLVYHHLHHPPIVVNLHSTTIPIFELGAPLLPPELPRSTISATLMKSLHVPRLKDSRNLSVWAPMQDIASRFETSLESLQFPQQPLVWVLHLPLSMYSIFQESNSPARRCLEYIVDGSNIVESNGVALSGVRLSSDNVLFLRAEQNKEFLQLTIAASDSTDLGFVRAQVLSKLPSSNGNDGKLEKLFVGQGCYEALIAVQAKWKSCKHKFETLYLEKTITSAEIVHLVQEVMRLELDMVQLYYKMRKLTNARVL
ncbi:hypothetical protein THRCLA_05863 [Thraustotheca clavata]|uniref:Uncharacterized protein n=1 Tax=Thraustotheca clavata TaxID=74557 RepID=A0A1V9ZS47_9STRA|nr:hypothetical protein THRCLA_05863 [Thraustotheca clavata]